MGDVTSTCCQSTTHLQQANLTREISVITQQKPQVLHQQPFQQAPQVIRQTIRTASKSKYFKYYNNLPVSLQSQSSIWNDSSIITIMKKNQPHNPQSNRSSNSILQFISSARDTYFNTYIKEITQQNQQQNINSQNKHLLQSKNHDNIILTGLFLIYFPNKQYFLGQLVKNQPTNGIFVFKHDCYYVGNIRNLHAQGQGKYQNKDNNYIYEGKWSKNLQHGQGQQFYTNSHDTFVGEFMYGSKFGQGVYNFGNGHKYEGYFYNGHSDGFGKLMISKKQWYNGQWKLGSIQGKGQYHYDNGDVYYGQFSNGVKQGHGRYVFSQGYEYDGQWQEGKMHGRGIIKQGYDEIEGEWVEGNKVA